MGEIWLDLIRVMFVDGKVKFVRRLVDWGSVTGLEENISKANKKAKTVILSSNSEPIWVVETIEEILEQAGVHMRGDIGFQGGNHE